MAAAAALHLRLSPMLHLRPSSIATNTVSSLSPRRTIYPCEYRRRESDAAGDDDGGELGRSRRRRTRRRRWWEDASPPSEMGGGIVEEVVESVWILKVFRIYGWWLPPILISMLLATGPKAFLLALAVMIGLSILTLAFTKLWGIVDNPKRGFRSKKRKKRGRTTNDVGIGEEEQEGTRMADSSWVSYDNGMSDSANDDFPDFKGWG